MRSVHFTNYDHLGQATISQSGSAGIDKGYVYSTYRDGKIKGASQEVYQNGRLYLKANSLTLISFFGFKKAGAEKYGNKWIFIPKTDVAYINLTASLTISGQMQQIKIPGKVTYLKNPKLNGKKVLGIVGHPQSQGGLSETEILYTSVTKNHLPLKATLSQGKNGYADVTFTKWNSIVKITLPTQSTPIGKTGLE